MIVLHLERGSAGVDNGKIERIIRDEQGLTTTGMVLSLLISLALIFTGAQVYRVNSISAEVQDVADAAVLSAENQVSEFLIIARFCDATVLSLSLTGITVTGLGVAALCTPATATVSEKLLSAGKDIIKLRDRFATRAARVLNRLQEALPYYSAACAAGVAAANNGNSSGANYLGVSVLVPSKGEEISVSPGDEAEKLLDDISDQADDIRSKAKEAEDAAEEANRAKERAFIRDCGDNPNYCMYERASQLAKMSGSDNPLYTNVDAWSFSVPLARAKVYYRTRLYSEAPSGSDVAEQVRSALRSHFYHFAVDELDRAYVRESSDSFQANFPHLPHNTDGMRHTRLYTDSVYPITTIEVKEGDTVTVKSVMHAWAGCPEAAGSAQLGSIKEMEEGDFKTCETCKFTAASLGKVAAASTSIDNGFEYHYEAVADEASVYEEERRKADAPKSEVKDKASGFLDRLKELVKDTFGKRIEPNPPGRFGSISFVVNIGSSSAAGNFASGFVSGDGTLGPRAALSAATLVGEESDEGKTVLNSMLDGLRQNGGVATGAMGMVLDAWSFLLSAYSNGQEAISSTIRNGLNSLPLVGASGLGDWVSDKLQTTMSDLGLQSVELRSFKPVLVNSRYVASKDDSAFSKNFVKVKQRIVSTSSGASDLFEMVLNGAEQEAIGQVGGLGDSIEIASIELFGENGPSIPITIPLPSEVKSYGTAAVQRLFDRIRSWHADSVDAKVWE